MSLQIKTNLPAIKAQRQLETNSRALADSMERLASGLRINRSADDAAGLAVSERIRAKVRSLDVAKRNAADAISYIQVAEGSLNEVSNIAVRMRELTSQAASDTLGNRERSFLDREFQQLRAEIGRIVDSTEFNGTKVLKSDENDNPIQIFVGASNRGPNLDGETPSFEENDPDILQIKLSDLGEFSSAMAKIVDEDVGLVPTDLDSGGARDLGATGTDELFARIDELINAIASFRATLGSVQSRLDSAVTNIEVSSENLNAARSRIVDADYAVETARFSQSRILTQAGLAVQAQANASPEMVLTLLR